MSENNEEIDDYAAQDLEIMNTMEATKHFCMGITCIQVISEIYKQKPEDNTFSYGFIFGKNRIYFYKKFNEESYNNWKLKNKDLQWPWR